VSADEIFVIVIVLASVIGFIIAERNSRRRHKARETEGERRKSA
jgi:hypothetical protein